jgi:hypothetical protein
MLSERLTILVSPEEKAAIVARASELGLSAGETLRLAFRTFGRLSPDDAVLEAFAADVETTLAETEARIDAVLDSAERTLAELRAGREAALAA